MSYYNYTKRMLTLVAAVLTMSLLLTACGDKEPEERAAFIDFLQTKVLRSEKVLGVALNEEQKKLVGQYTADYDIIKNFFSDIYAAEEKTKKADINAIMNFSKVMENQKALEEADTTLKALIADIDAAMAKADAAKAALKQPEDLKAVFDKVYEKEVVKYGTIKRDVYVKSHEMFEEVLTFIKFLEAHKDVFELKGQTVMVMKESPALEKELSEIQKALEQKGKAVQAATVKLKEIR